MHTFFYSFLVLFVTVFTPTQMYFLSGILEAVLFQVTLSQILLLIVASKVLVHLLPSTYMSPV